jgi:hypothetical protein
LTISLKVLLLNWFSSLKLEEETMNDSEKAMYTGIAMCRNTEVTQRWARSQIYLLIHSAGLSLTITSQKPTFFFLFFTSLGGLVLTFFWYIANLRTNQWIVYWQSRLAALETAEPNPAQLGFFRGADWDRITSSWHPFHFIVNALIGFFAVAWFIIFIRAFLV